MQPRAASTLSESRVFPRPSITAALAGLALLLLPVATAGAQVPRDDIVVGMAVEPAGLDPTIAAPVAIGQVVWQNVFEGLTRIDEAGAVKPQLAETWDVSPDGLVYTFTLHEGVTFSNGAPFNAETAKFTLDRARGEASVNPQKPFFRTIAAVEAKDARTLVVTLSRPTANLAYWLAWPASVMVEPGSAQTNRTNPIGTGPFVVTAWRQGDRVEMARRADYWDREALPKLARATFRFIADPQAQASAVESRGVDAFPEFGAPELYTRFVNDADLRTVAGVTELKVVAGLNGRRKPFDDARVRQALMMAVDRATLIEGAYSGYGTAIGSHYTPNDPGYRDLTGIQPYDAEKAKALLAEAGYPAGFSMTLKTPQMSYALRSSEILQALFAEIGVTVTIVPTEFPAKWIADVFTGHDFDMTIVAHAEPLDIGVYSRPDYYFGYRNPAFDATIERAETAGDEDARLAAYGEAQEMLARDVPALYLFALPKLGVWNPYLQGLWANEPIPSNDLTDVSWGQ